MQESAKYAGFLFLQNKVGGECNLKRHNLSLDFDVWNTV